MADCLVGRQEAITLYSTLHRTPAIPSLWNLESRVSKIQFRVGLKGKFKVSLGYKKKTVYLKNTILCSGFLNEKKSGRVKAYSFYISLKYDAMENNF